MTDYTFAGFYKSEASPVVSDIVKQRALDGEFKEVLSVGHGIGNEKFDFVIPGNLEINIQSVGRPDMVKVTLQLLDPKTHEPLVFFGDYMLDISISDKIILANTPPWPIKIT